MAHDSQTTVLSPPKTITLGLIDGYVAALDGISAWFAANAPEITVVLRARTWHEVRAIGGELPDVYLVGIQSFDAPLLRAHLEERGAECIPVVAWGDPDDAETGRQLRAAGVAFVLGKANSLDDARGAVNEAVRHGIPAAGTAAGLGVPAPWPADSLAGLPPVSPAVRQRPENGRSADDGLTADDIEAVRLYAFGNSPIDIALRMNVRFERVREHLAAARQHYEGQGRRASTRLELIQRVSEDGLLGT